MRRGVALIAAALAIALPGSAAAGTGVVHPSGPDPTLSEWPSWPYPVSCAGAVVDPVAGFAGPTEAQNGAGGPEQALRRYIEEGLYSQTPRLYWRLVSLSATRADFASGLLALGPFWLSFQLVEGRWAPIGSPATCKPRSVIEGREAIGWRLSAGQGIGPRTRTVRIELIDDRCHGKRSLSELVEKPRFWTSGSRLMIGIWLPPLGRQKCPRPREKPLVVKLPGALGKRRLFDGSVYPPLPRSSRFRQ